MFERTSQLPASASKGSPIAQALSLLGTAGGIAAAILLTPLLFGLTEQILLSYLGAQWGPGLASLLTVVMGGIECLVIFIVTKLVISLAATSAIVALAARRIPFA